MGVWEITVKDLRLILKDRGALYTLLALPVVFIAILGMSTGELITTHEVSKLLKIGVVIESTPQVKKAIFSSPIAKPMRINAPNSVFALGNAFSKS